MRRCCSAMRGLTRFTPSRWRSGDCFENQPSNVGVESCWQLRLRCFALPTLKFEKESGVGIFTTRTKGWSLGFRSIEPCIGWRHSFALGWRHSIVLDGGINCIQHALAAPSGLLLPLLVQQPVTLILELVFDRIPPLVDGSDLTQELAPLLRALMANPMQNPEREL